LAETIPNEIAAAGPVRVIFSDDLLATDLARTDLVIMGKPTHNMNLPKTVRPVLARLPKRCL